MPDRQGCLSRSGDLRVTAPMGYNLQSCLARRSKIKEIQERSFRCLEKANNLLAVSLFIFGFCFQQALNGYLVSTKADAKVLVEGFGGKSLQEFDQSFLGNPGTRQKFL